MMNGEKAKLLATDPPYLVDYVANHPEAANSPGANEWDTYSGDASGVSFYVAFLEAAFPHLTERAPIYQWHANLRQAVVSEAWAKTGLLLHQVIIWVKTHGTLGRSHYMWQHEPCAYGWRTGMMPRLKPPASDTTVWHVEQKGEQDEDHPTQKPAELLPLSGMHPEGLRGVLRLRTPRSLSSRSRDASYTEREAVAAKSPERHERRSRKGTALIRLGGTRCRRTK